MHTVQPKHAGAKKKKNFEDLSSPPRLAGDLLGLLMQMETIAIFQLGYLKAQARVPNALAEVSQQQQSQMMEEAAAVPEGGRLGAARSFKGRCIALQD